MNEMLVRVAWAIERVEEDLSGAVIVGRQFATKPHPESLAMARAAIEAMMSPTPEMLAAGASYFEDGIAPQRLESKPDKDGIVTFTYKPGIWRAMITAALIGD